MSAQGGRGGCRRDPRHDQGEPPAGRIGDLPALRHLVRAGATCPRRPSPPDRRPRRPCGPTRGTLPAKPGVETGHRCRNDRGGISRHASPWGTASPVRSACWHAAQTPISPPSGAGRTSTAGASRQRSQIEPTRGAWAPWSRTARWVTRRRRAAVNASWRDGAAGWACRHPAAPARSAGAAPCTPDSRPTTRSCARPSGRFPSSHMPCPPLPRRLFAVDLGSHHSMKRQRLATCLWTARAAWTGKLAWPGGPASEQARVSGRLSV